MTALQAVLPLLWLAVGAGCVGALVWARRKSAKQELPTDPLSELFVKENDEL